MNHILNGYFQVLIKAILDAFWALLGHFSGLTSINFVLVSRLGMQTFSLRSFNFNLRYILIDLGMLQCYMWRRKGANQSQQRAFSKTTVPKRTTRRVATGTQAVPARIKLKKYYLIDHKLCYYKYHIKIHHKRLAHAYICI